jgi:hypothetical protein
MGGYTVKYVMQLLVESEDLAPGFHSFSSGLTIGPVGALLGHSPPLRLPTIGNFPREYGGDKKAMPVQYNLSPSSNLIPRFLARMTVQFPPLTTGP